MQSKKMIFVVLSLVLLSFCASAQPGGGGDPGGGKPVPLSGVELLLLVGGALGGYKFFKRNCSNDKGH
jgi:hypothetical protein